MLSISKMRGCFAAAGPPALIVIALALIVGLILPGQCGGDPSGQPGEAIDFPLGEVLFTVNGEPAYDGEVRFLRAKTAEQAPRTGDPLDELNLQVQPIALIADKTLVVAMAKWQGVKVEESEVIDHFTTMLNKNIEDALKQAREMHSLMVTSAETALKNAKETKGADSKEAKDAQANLDQLKARTDDEIFAQVAGTDLATARTQIESSLQEVKASAMYQRVLMGTIYETRLVDKFKGEVKVTDDMAKESYDQVTYREIVFLKLLDANYEQRAQDVLKKLQNGMDFNQAMLQYSDRKPGDINKASDAETTLERMMLWASPDTRPISDVKPNRISGIIKTEVGATIVKVTGVEVATPANFESVKASRIDQIKQAIGGSKYQVAKQEYEAEAKYEWKSESAKLLFDYSQIVTNKRASELDGEKNRAKRIEAWRDILTRSEEADELDATVASLLRYSAFTQIELNTPPGEGREKLKKEKADLYKQIELEIPHSRFRVEFVQALLDVNDGEGALKEILNIAENLYDPSDAERERVKQLETLLPKAANLAPKNSPLIGKIQAELERWHSEEKEAKRIEEEQKKLDEADRKAMEKEAREQQAKASEPQKDPDPPASNEGAKKGG